MNDRTLTNQKEDHVTLSTISEVETKDKTPDDFLDPEFLKMQEDL